MKKTLLFGGSGFFGPTILEKYPEIISVGRSPPPEYVKNRHIQITDIGDLSPLDEVEFDKVIFVIGNSDHHQINKMPTMGIDYNVIPMKKALFYMKERDLKKFICFSTILLYDSNKVSLPVSEQQAINPYANDYVFSKYFLEETAKFYSHKVPIITARLTNIYGPTKQFNQDVMVITSLIEKVLSPHEAKVLNIDVVRDFLFTYDAADAVVRLLNTDYTGIVNVASGLGTNIGTIVRIIEELSGKKIKVLDQPATGHLKFIADITKLKELTGWKPKYSIEEGIKITYDKMASWADECKWWEQPGWKA